MQYIGIMGAMPEEIAGALELLDNRKEREVGGRVYYTGTISDLPVVLVFSRWGKVAAASTVATLIHEFDIYELIFTGVAGAVDPVLKVGDIVIGDRLIQHDMDARPLMPRFEIPLLEKSWFEADPVYTARASDAIRYVLENRHLQELISVSVLEEFHIKSPALYTGDIASGDLFFSSHAQRTRLQELLPSVLCVEMEGAAVAQVCYENKIPFTLIRTISDRAGDNSGVDFPLFVSKVASKYSKAILQRLFQKM